MLLKQKYKNLITIIIPRHVHRVSKIKNNITELGLKTVNHSENKKSLDDIDIYIVDTFGESKKFYKLATTVFVGGSIFKRGGHNPLEPARYGAKILHGPYIENFTEIYKLLNSLKISTKINTSKEFANQVIFKKYEKVLKIRKLGNVILKKTLKELNQLISYENKKTQILGL